MHRRKEKDVLTGAFEVEEEHEAAHGGKDVEGGEGLGHALLVNWWWLSQGPWHDRGQTSGLRLVIIDPVSSIECSYLEGRERADEVVHVSLEVRLPEAALPALVIEAVG